MTGGGLTFSCSTCGAILNPVLGGDNFKKCACYTTEEEDGVNVAKDNIGQGGTEEGSDLSDTSEDDCEFDDSENDFDTATLQAEEEEFKRCAEANIQEREEECVQKYMQLLQRNHCQPFVLKQKEWFCIRGVVREGVNIMLCGCEDSQSRLTYHHVHRCQKTARDGTVSLYICDCRGPEAAQLKKMSLSLLDLTDVSRSDVVKFVQEDACLKLFPCMHTNAMEIIYDGWTKGNTDWSKMNDDPCWSQRVFQSTGNEAHLHNVRKDKHVKAFHSVMLQDEPWPTMVAQLMDGSLQCEHRYHSDCPHIQNVSGGVKIEVQDAGDNEGMNPMIETHEEETNELTKALSYKGVKRHWDKNDENAMKVALARLRAIKGRASSGTCNIITVNEDDRKHHLSHTCTCPEEANPSVDVIQAIKEYPVYSHNGVAYVLLQGLRCTGTQCTKITYADGQSDGVFVWSLSAGYDHGYLEMTVHDLHRGVTEAAAYESFVIVQTRVGGDKNFPCKTTWKQAINAYIDMIDDKPCEECPICGDPNNMKYLVVDGTTSGSVQKKLTNWAMRGKERVPHVGTGLVYGEMRTSVGMTKALRELLLRFAGGTVKTEKEKRKWFDEKEAQTQLKQRRELSKEEHEGMRRLMTQCELIDKVHFMTPIIEYVLHNAEEGKEAFVIPRTDTANSPKWQVMRDIIVEVASCAKCYSMHNDVHANIKSLQQCIELNGERVFNDQDVRETCATGLPLLYKLMMTHEGHIPEHYMGILKLWHLRAKKYVDGLNKCRISEGLEKSGETDFKEDGREARYNLLNASERYKQRDITVEEDAARGAHCHTSLRKQRISFEYARDRRDVTPGAIASIMGDETHERNGMTEDACTKEQNLSQRFLPGVFTMLCPHGICYGVIFMTEFESPKTIFEAIWNR